MAGSNEITPDLPDRLTNGIGTMKFIYWATLVIILWMILNSVKWFPWHWDPYPFVFLNLAFSAFAFYSAPLILMSQNRQSANDRIKAAQDLEADEETRQWSRAIGAKLGVNLDATSVMEEV